MDIEKGDIEASGNVSSEENPQSKGDASASATELGMNVEDFLLPRSITQRLAKGVLPPNTAIHRDAMLAITKAATVFVSYLSSHANEETNKKTITPQDVLAALSGIEFESFRPRLERELALYTEAAARKRRGKKGEKDAPNTDGNEAANEEPENKRLKRDIGDSEEKDQGQKSGDNATATNGDYKMSGHHDAQQSKVSRQGGDDKGGDSTDTMEDTNIMDDEEESNDDADKHGEEEEEDEVEEDEEEDEEKELSQEIEIESDASRKRDRRRSGLDSDSGSDSDGL